MGEDQKGVLVRSVQPISFAHGHLLPGDVLMAFDGIEVACGELLSSIKAAGLLDLEVLSVVTACRSCILKLGPRALLTPFQLPPTPCADGTVPLLSGNRIEFFSHLPCSHRHNVRVTIHYSADGTVPFLSGERIAFSYLTSQKFTGEVATLDVLRDGQPMRLEIKVRSEE